MENSFADRRKHKRINFSSSVSIKENQLDDAFNNGVVRNISMGGLAVETAKKLAVGQKYNFRFFLPNKLMVAVNGIIVWEYEEKESNFYGVQFIGFRFLDRFKLKFFINKKLKEAAYATGSFNSR